MFYSIKHFFMKEKIHIAVLSLWICALIGMTFAVSSRDYKEKAPNLNSAPESSKSVSEGFSCTSKNISSSSQETKEYEKNIKKMNDLLSKIDTLGGDSINLSDPCEWLKGKEKSECNINNIELRSLIRQVKKLEEKMFPYEECMEKLWLINNDKEISGEINTGGKTKKKEGTRTTNLPGNNNDIVWSAKDPNVRIKYLASAGITTTVAVEGKDVIVTPGIKTNMLVSGSLTPKSPINPARLLMYAGKDGSWHVWTHNGIMMSFSGLKSGEASMSYNGQNWTYASHSWTGDFADYVAQKIAKTITPDGLRDWTVYVWSGQPTVTALPSNASQVIAAVAADPVASKLLVGTLAPGNDGTGAISAMDMLTFCTSDSGSSACTDNDEEEKNKKKEGIITTKEKKLQPINQWSEWEWSTCSNGKQTRKVECLSNGKKVADSKCEWQKPVTTKTCAEIAKSTSNTENNKKCGTIDSISFDIDTKRQDQENKSMQCFSNSIISCSPANLKIVDQETNNNYSFQVHGKKWWKCSISVNIEEYMKKCDISSDLIKEFVIYAKENNKPIEELSVVIGSGIIFDSEFNSQFDREYPEYKMSCQEFLNWKPVPSNK